MQPPLPPPLEKSHPLLKVEVLSRPPFLKTWFEAQPPLAEKGGGHYVNNYITCSCDNTNSMIGPCNNVLQEIKNAQGNQKIFDIGCPCHLVYLCAEREPSNFL